MQGRTTEMARAGKLKQNIRKPDSAKGKPRKNLLTPAEKRINRLLIEANLRFVRSGIEIEDVYGVLED